MRAVVEANLITQFCFAMETREPVRLILGNKDHWWPRLMESADKL